MRVLLILILATSATSAPFARRTDALNDEAAVASIKSIEQQWLDHEHDRATLEHILADDFVHPVAAGVFLTRAQHIDWAAAHPSPPAERRHFDPLNVRIYGDTAIATGIVAASDRGGATRRTIFTDVFVRRAGRWQAVNAQENSIPK